MKKFFLSVFIIVDLAVVAAASFFIYTTIEGKLHRAALPARTGVALHRPATLPGAAAPGATTIGLSSAPAASSAMPPAASSNPYRNIGFTYRNSKARQVLIRADFTGWKGVPMKRDANGVWSYSHQLTPGEYGYCFTIVDHSGRSVIIKDPANKHSKRVAQIMVSSITVEKAGTPKPAAVEP